MNRGTLYLFFDRSQIGKTLDKVIKFLSVNLPTSVLIKLIVAIFEVILIPCVVLAGSCHDLHDEFSKVVL